MELSNSILISIIVPIYNVGEYLDQCIKSIVNQNIEEIEIILVNDGSPDNSKEICEKYAKLDSRIILLNKENGGLVSARKAGLTIAKGKYIGYVDGDDWIEEEMFSEMLQYAMNFDVDIVISGHKEEVNDKVTEILFNNIDEGYYSFENIQRKVIPFMINTGVFSEFGIFSYVWNKLFKRDLLMKTQFSVDDNIFMAEDAACTYPSILLSNSIYILKSAKYHYRQRINSMVKTRNSEYLDISKYSILFEHLSNYFIKSSHSEVLMKQLNAFLLSLIAVRFDYTNDLDNNNNLFQGEFFPFGKVTDLSNLALVGAGTFGQHIMRRLISLEKNEDLVWIDAQYEGTEIMGMKIYGYDTLCKLKDRLILIAHIDENIALQKEQQLLRLGIQPSKIRKTWLFEEKNHKKLLMDFNII